MSGGSDVVLVRGGQAELLAERLAAEYPQVGIVMAGSGDIDLSTVTIAAGSVKDTELTDMPDLDWVHCWAAGVESEVGPRLRRSGITVTSSAGNGAIPLAEHAMMLTLMLDRQADRWFNAQCGRRWDRFTHSELHGKTMGIYGFGNVGRELALRARAFGMRVVALRRRFNEDADLVDRMYGPDNLCDFAAESDVLVVTAAKNRETEGAINASVLASLKTGAHVVVVSRANIIDEQHLLDALRCGQVAAAGLDAHAQEPLPPDSPYWTIPGVIITPHNGATTAATAARGTEIFFTNLRRRLNHLPYRNQVDIPALT